MTGVGSYAATLQGESIKDFVLKRTLPDIQEQEALEKLEAFLKPRIQSVKTGKISNDTVDEIFNAVLNKR